MEFTEESIQPGVVVLKVAGSVRVGPTCRQIEQAVEGMIRRHETRVILDLSGVSYIDSSGIGTLVKCLAKLNKSGGTLCLTGVKAMVGDALKLTRVDSVLKVHPTVSEALRDLPPVTNPQQTTEFR